jgi:hypothetical protein
MIDDAVFITDNHVPAVPGRGDGKTFHPDRVIGKRLFFKNRKENKRVETGVLPVKERDCSVIIFPSLSHWFSGRSGPVKDQFRRVLFEIHRNPSQTASDSTQPADLSGGGYSCSATTSEKITQYLRACNNLFIS